MGDVRFQRIYDKLVHAPHPASAVRALDDASVISALAVAAHGDPFLANVLATEAHNRMQKARAALLHLGEGVLFLDEDERILLANPAAETILGWEPGTLMHRSMHGLVHGHETPQADCSFARLATDGGDAFHSDDDRFTRRNGSTFPVAYTAAPVLREGERIGCVLVFRDITERLEATQALEESEARWRALAEATFEGVVLHVNGQLVAANRAARRMFGVDETDPRALDGRTIYDFIVTSEHQTVRRIVASGNESAYRVLAKRADGTTFRCEARGRQVPYQGGHARVAALRRLDG